MQQAEESLFPTRCRENGEGDFDTDNMMCLFTSSDGQTGTCFGDSGCPVVRQLSDTSWRLVGLVDEGVFPGCVNTHIKANWLQESDTANNVAHRTVILGGEPGMRTATVPPFPGIEG